MYKFYNSHLLLTVPRTNDSVFNLPEGTFSFPSSEELFFPFHNAIWTINETNNDNIRLHISYNVENCTDCNCDKIEVSSPIMYICFVIVLHQCLIFIPLIKM